MVRKILTAKKYSHFLFVLSKHLKEVHFACKIKRKLHYDEKKFKVTYILEEHGANQFSKKNDKNALETSKHLMLNRSTRSSF